MPFRPLVVSIFIFIFLIIGIYWIYNKLHSQHLAYHLDPNQHWIGVIDLNADHGMDMKGVINGDDALLILDSTNPLLMQLLRGTTSSRPDQALKNFELADFDSNSDGILNQSDPIFHFLRVLAFNPDTKLYVIRSLPEAGIRGIRIEHLQGLHKHDVILSDGTSRSLYELNQPGGTAIYKNPRGTTITNILPSIQ